MSERAIVVDKNEFFLVCQDCIKWATELMV